MSNKIQSKVEFRMSHIVNYFQSAVGFAS